MAKIRVGMVKGKGIDWGGWLLYLGLTSVAIIMLAPLVYLVSTAFKPIEELFLFPPRFFFINPTMKNFYDLLLITGTSWVPFSRYIFNSVVISIGVVVGSVVFAAMAAYPLSKHFEMPFRNGIFQMIIIALMFAPQVTQIPQYLVVSNIGLMDSYMALILPALAAPIGLFLMKQFLDQFPNAFLEAAKIDGASEWRIFWQIVMPLLRPAWATVSLFAFIAIWNDPWAAMVYTTTEEMKTLPLALQTISGGFGVIARVGTLAAASLLMTLPVVIVFVVTQKLVLQTMAHSGLKE